MCDARCYNAICQSAARRGLLKSGFAVAASLAASATSPFAAHAASTPRSGFHNALDLTHTLFPGFPTFSGKNDWFQLEPLVTYAKSGMNINRWTVVEHTGTHIDAPLHFSADGMSVELVAINDLVVPLAVIDISSRAQHNPDTALTPDDVKAWESRNGPLPEGCCVAMNSGWGKLLASPRFIGLDAAGKNHTPGFHAETAHMLLNERRVKGLGVDTLSLDPGLMSGPFPVHNAWLPTGRWGVEALANLDLVPARGAHLVLGAPKVKGGTGGPARAIALL